MKLIEKWLFWGVILTSILAKLQPQAPLCAIPRRQSYMHGLKALLQQSSWSNSVGSTTYQWGLMALSKCPLESWIFGAQRAKNDRPPITKTKSQRSEPNWLLKYLIIPNFCANFQPKRLTTTFGPWNTFSDNDTQIKGREFFKEHKKLKHRKV